jgi:hypothetical protein
MALGVECLTHKCEALSSNTSTVKKKKSLTPCLRLCLLFTQHRISGHCLSSNPPLKSQFIRAGGVAQMVECLSTKKSIHAPPLLIPRPQHQGHSFLLHPVVFSGSSVMAPPLSTCTPDCHKAGHPGKFPASNQ